MLSGTRSTHPPINWGPSLEREGGRKTTRDVLQALSREAQSNHDAAGGFKQPGVVSCVLA